MVFEEMDEDLSDGGRQMWRGRIFSGGSWSLDVTPTFPSPMKMGFGVKTRESNGEMMTLSTLCGPGELKSGMKRSEEPTHDKHA
jgi:hypothetical protein